MENLNPNFLRRNILIKSWSDEISTIASSCYRVACTQTPLWNLVSCIRYLENSIAWIQSSTMSHGQNPVVIWKCAWVMWIDPQIRSWGKTPHQSSRKVNFSEHDFSDVQVEDKKKILAVHLKFLSILNYSRKWDSYSLLISKRANIRSIDNRS